MLNPSQIIVTLDHMFECKLSQIPIEQDMLSCNMSLWAHQQRRCSYGPSQLKTPNGNITVSEAGVKLIAVANNNWSWEPAGGGYAECGKLTVNLVSVYGLWALSMLQCHASTCSQTAAANSFEVLARDLVWHGLLGKGGKRGNSVLWKGGWSTTINYRQPLASWVFWTCGAGIHLLYSALWRENRQTLIHMYWKNKPCTH